MEEKNEKKNIKCSYALLVIILFATVAFLTDYIIIDRKTSKCYCPKCEAPNNEVKSDNTQVTDGKTYSYEDIAGVYRAEEKIDNNILPEYGTAYYSLILYSNGTYSYSRSVATGFTLYGNYYVKNNEIHMNKLLETDEKKSEVRSGEFVLTIDSNGSIVDNNSENRDLAGLDSITLKKEAAEIDNAIVDIYDAINEYKFK